MRASVSRLSHNTRPRIPLLATSRIRYTTTAATLYLSSYQRFDLGKLGDRGLSSHSFHTSSPSSKLGRPRWLKRGMRGRIRAWAGSLGLTEGQESPRETDEPLGEELYVMPGWAVAKGRERTEDGMSTNGTVDPSIGELSSTPLVSHSNCSPFRPTCLDFRLLLHGPSSQSHNSYAASYGLPCSS